jgi:alanine dehydrogenase
VKLADLGVVEAAKRDRALALGVNTFNGHCTYKAVADALDLPYTPVDKAFATQR